MDDRASRARFWLPTPGASEALELARELERALPWWPGATLLRGRVALECESWDEAAKAFATASTFGFPDATLGAELAQQQLGIDAGDKQLPLRKRLRLRLRLSRPTPEPTYGGTARLTDLRFEAFAWRVLALQRVGMKRRAMARAWFLVEYHPARWEAWALFATIAGDRARRDVAVEALGRALELGAPLTEARELVGQLVRQRRFDEAVNVARETMPAQGDQALLLGLAGAEAAADNWTAAADAFTKARALDSHSIEAICGLAHAQLRLGRIDEAWDGTTRALKLSPNEPSVKLLAAEVATASRRVEVGRRYAASVAWETQVTDPEPWGQSQSSLAHLLGRIPPVQFLARRIRRSGLDDYAASRNGAFCLEDALPATSDLADDLRARVDHAQWRRSLLVASEEVMTEVLAGATIIGLLALTILAGPVFGVREVEGVTLVLIWLGQLMLFALLSSAVVWLSEASGGVRSSVAGFTVILLLSTGIVAWLRNDDVPASALLLLSVPLTTCLIMWLALAAFGLHLSMLLFERKRVHDDPWAACLAALLRSLRGVERLSARKAENEESVVAAIEMAARALQTTMQRTMEGNDGLTATWFEGRVAGHIAALRCLKAWVVSPGPESLSALQGRLTRDVRAIARREWRDLEWIDPEPLALSRHRLAGLALVRNLVIGATPVIALIVLEALNVLELGDAVRGQAFLAALVWAAVTLLTTLDPDFNSRLGSVRDSFSSVKAARRDLR